MQSLFDYLQNENTMLFAGGITVSILLTIVLVVVVFSTRTKIIANRYHDLKQIDKQKSQKIAILETDLHEIKTEHIALLKELELFEQTKIKLNTATQQLKESQSHIKTLSKELSKTQTALTESNKAIETLHQDNEKLNERYNSAEGQNTRLRMNHSILTTKLDSVERQSAVVENDDQENRKKQLKNHLMLIKQQMSLLSLEILKPLQAEIASYAQKNSSKDQESPNIKEEIIALKRLYEVISQDTINLSNALKENGQTNIWNTMVLDRILEASGLQPSEYRRDFSMSSSDNEIVKIDAIVRLPDTHVLLVDAQTPMNFYQLYLEAPSVEQKSFFLKQYLLAVKGQYETLRKQNEYKLNTPTKLEFVLMMMPVEGALNLVLTHDRTLYNEAFGHKILMVGPAMLLVLMRVVHSFWLTKHSDTTTASVSISSGFEKLNDALVKLSSEIESV